MRAKEGMRDMDEAVLRAEQVEDGEECGAILLEDLKGIVEFRGKELEGDERQALRRRARKGKFCR